MTRRCAGLLAALVLLAGALPARPAAQDLTADELIEGLEGFLKRKNDDNAVGTLDLLAQSFASFTEDEQKEVAKAVEKCLGQRREEGDDRLYIAALKSLTQMGPLGLKATAKSLKSKNVKDRREVLACAVSCLGTFKDVKSLDSILDFLVHTEPVVAAAAVTTLGENFQENEEKVRKEIVEQLVKTYASYASQAVANPREPIYQERLNVVEGALKTSLTQLTGQSHEDAPAWQKWYNDNKRKRWDEEEDG